MCLSGWNVLDLKDKNAVSPIEMNTIILNLILLDIVKKKEAVQQL